MTNAPEDHVVRRKRKFKRIRQRKPKMTWDERKCGDRRRRSSAEGYMTVQQSHGSPNQHTDSITKFNNMYRYCIYWYIQAKERGTEKKRKIGGIPQTSQKRANEKAKVHHICTLYTPKLVLLVRNLPHLTQTLSSPRQTILQLQNFNL